MKNSTFRRLETSATESATVAMVSSGQSPHGHIPVSSSGSQLKAPKTTASFHDFDAYERLVDAARTDALAYLIVLLGGEAGLRCDEIMALEWSNVDCELSLVVTASSAVRGRRP
jgi:integrase